MRKTEYRTGQLWEDPYGPFLIVGVGEHEVVGFDLRENKDFSVIKNPDAVLLSDPHAEDDQ